MNNFLTAAYHVFVSNYLNRLNILFTGIMVLNSLGKNLIFLGSSLALAPHSLQLQDEMGAVWCSWPPSWSILWGMAPGMKNRKGALKKQPEKCYKVPPCPQWVRALQSGFILVRGKLLLSGLTWFAGVSSKYFCNATHAIFAEPSP